MNSRCTQFEFSHIGVAVNDILKAVGFYERAFRYKLIKGPLTDPIQKATLCFLDKEPFGSGTLELIMPSCADSKVHDVLARQLGAYHVCYKVASIDEAVAWLRTEGCVLFQSPVPAVAFDGRRIAWLLTPTRALLELLEAN